jgi:hypothetical protein
MILSGAIAPSLPERMKHILQQVALSPILISMNINTYLHVTLCLNQSSPSSIKLTEESVISLSCGSSSPEVRNDFESAVKPRFVALLVYRQA